MLECQQAATTAPGCCSSTAWHCVFAAEQQHICAENTDMWINNIYFKILNIFSGNSTHWPTSSSKFLRWTGKCCARKPSCSSSRCSDPSRLCVRFSKRKQSSELKEESKRGNGAKKLKRGKEGREGLGDCAVVGGCGDAFEGNGPRKVPQKRRSGCRISFAAVC